MAYATQADLLQRMTLQELIQLTDDSRPPTAVNETVVNNELAKASGVVESYCRDRYLVPLQISLDVTSIVVDLAVYALFSRRPQKLREEIKDSRTAAIAFLKDISSGKASLDQPSGAPTPQTSAGDATLPTCTNERFTEHMIDGFV